MSDTGILSAAPDRGTAWRQEIAATLRLAWPLAAANLLQMLVWAIDVMFIARLGTIPLAAASLSFALFGTLMWSLTGLTGMVSALIAAALGRGTGVVREVRRATRMAMWLAIISATILAVAMYRGEAFMLMTGQEAEISALAGEFLAVLGWAAIPMLLCNVLRSYVSALDRPVIATVVVGLQVAVAALANYVLVFGHFGFPALGMVGSALASSVTAWLGVLAYVALIQSDRRLRSFHIFGRWWSPDWSYFRRLIVLGAPVTLTIVAEGGLFNSAAFMMGLIGADQLAAHTLALQLAAFAFQVPFGVSQAATIRVGYFYGAGDRDGIARAGWAAIVVGTGFMLTTATAMLVAPLTLLSLYIDPRAPQYAATVGFAVVYLRVAAAFQLFDGFQAVAAGSLRGLQDTSAPMWIALVGFWIPGLATMLWLGFRTPLEGLGIWIGLLVALVVVAAGLLGRWLLRERFGLLPVQAA
ncbi:Multidrug resistance protein NorM [Tsuneonella dongtanensis]|uniref:Multidrug resistance protein NorM n=1 Tax=Tsuneonella dongtanensis TaxID=692370 RepID=A0A1B2A9G2_9SPHN|nr:MATE family efflux transporter [Tsuneonella dongtanensis]ANY18718.1 Multidrug resistance protein NorM [Tsuneonella dongtanensis]